MQRWQRLLAFAVIYFVWGSTFLAIRIGVLEVPPLLFAAMRFFVAGVALFGWMIARGEPIPNRREWRSIFLLQTQRLTGRLAAALAIGIAGVAVLVSRSLNLGGAPVDRSGAIALIIGAI